VCGQDTGFKIESDPDTVRASDVAVVCRARVGLIPSRGYAAFAPDLVAEIVSPDDRPGEVLTKVGQWIDAGTMLVWVIDPSRVEARTYRDDGGLTIVSSEAFSTPARSSLGLHARLQKCFVRVPPPTARS
jgi:Uma2 family endonuclease